MDEKPSSSLTDQLLKSFQDRITMVLAIVTAILGLLTLFVSEVTAKRLVAIGFLLGLVIWGIRWYRNSRRFQEKYIGIADLPRSGLRGLLAFEEGDNLFGRNADIMGLTAILNDRDFRYGVLSGESGCGKTSLIRAGILPQLRKNNIIPIYLSSPTKDPRERIRNQIKDEYADLLQDSKDVFEALEKLAKREKKKVVILADQFEEFFILNRSMEVRSSFAKWLSNAMKGENKHTCFLFVVRKDFFSDLHSFYPFVADPIEFRQDAAIQESAAADHLWTADRDAAIN